MDPIVGIDLGTTNSEVAFLFDGQVTVICENDNGIVPSCVGMTEAGGIITGAAARNQAVIAPERTVLSIKRRMGEAEKVSMGNNAFLPQEISAFTLKALKERAERRIGSPVHRAVITVPAYFTDAQRQATREAGQIAGLEVVRIINEPTAAALAYEPASEGRHHLLVYDLGGGTFDVSIVRMEQGVVEVLASTGDNHLGGDDFDRRIVAHLMAHMENELHLKPEDTPRLRARLQHAAERAKIELSSNPFAMIEEDHIGRKAFQDVHLSLELSRDEFEGMVEADLTRTMDLVNRALKDAQMLPMAIDQIILAGGSTRIPLVSEMLNEKFKKQPLGHIDPDLCVAMGAGIQAAREMGVDTQAVLVDITPYTFGTSAVGFVNGAPSDTMFVPVIQRNTKLPAKKSDVFYTMVDEQEAVDVRVYQGEAPDAEDNVLLGNYIFKLTPAPAGSDIVMHFDLDLNGILKVKAVEKKTGKSIDATIENAISRFSEAELRETRARIGQLWSGEPGLALEDKDGEGGSSSPGMPDDLADIIRRSEAHLAHATPEDQAEMINLIEAIRDAIEEGRLEDARAFRDELDDILFYGEG